MMSGLVAQGFSPSYREPLPYREEGDVVSGLPPVAQREQVRHVRLPRG
jgi:hypothetical protein